MHVLREKLEGTPKSVKEQGCLYKMPRQSIQQFLRYLSLAQSCGLTAQLALPSTEPWC